MKKRSQSRMGTLADAQRYGQNVVLDNLPPPIPELLAYLDALKPRKWTAFSDLKKQGYNIHWFDELVQRGLCEGKAGPHRIENGKRYGTRYWFRLPEVKR